MIVSLSQSQTNFRANPRANKAVKTAAETLASVSDAVAKNLDSTKANPDVPKAPQWRDPNLMWYPGGYYRKEPGGHGNFDP